MKYRVVLKNGEYYPQRRVFGLFWLNVTNHQGWDDSWCKGRLSQKEAREDCENDAASRNQSYNTTVIEEFDL